MKSSKIKMKLLVKTLARVSPGSGRTSLHPLIHKPIVRRFTEGHRLRPYIPATTFKGVVKASFTQLANSISEATCTATSPEDIKAQHEKLNADCIRCRVFGGPDKHGKLFFRDVIFDEEFKPESSVGIRIDRRSSMVATGALYSYEFIQPNITGKTIIEGENLTKHELKLLLASLLDLEHQGLGSRSMPVRVILEKLEGEYESDEAISRLIELLSKEER